MRFPTASSGIRFAVSTVLSDAAGLIYDSASADKIGSEAVRLQWQSWREGIVGLVAVTARKIMQ